MHSRVIQWHIQDFIRGGGGNFLLATTAHTKRVGKSCFPIFSMVKFFLPKGSWPNVPLNTPLASSTCFCFPGEFQVVTVCKKNKQETTPLSCPKLSRLAIYSAVFVEAADSPDAQSCATQTTPSSIHGSYNTHILDFIPSGLSTGIFYSWNMSLIAFRYIRFLWNWRTR